MMVLMFETLDMLDMLDMLWSPEVFDMAMVYAGMKSLKISGIFLLRSRLSSGVGLVVSVLLVDGV